MLRFSALSLSCALSLASIAAAQERIPLSSLDLSLLRQGWGEPQIDKSIEGKPLTIGGRIFERGVGSHAASVLYLELDGGTERFSAWIGVDDETQGRGSLVYKVYGDGELLFDSGTLRGGEPARELDVDLRGVQRAMLVTDGAGDGIDYDHANWAEAVFHVTGAKPRAVGPPVEEKVILTPPPRPAPRINGPGVWGVRPGRPVLYRIPCTGERPIAFAAEGLPDSLVIDPARGTLAGSAPGQAGTVEILLSAQNRHGRHQKRFELRVGEELALTPPMGWNSWYIHYDRVTDADMRAAADAMVASGMADFGYRYVNIDDCWMKKRGEEPYRDEGGAVLCNAKFPDMLGLTDYIHSQGLLAGLYTSPGPWTCAGYVGAYGHEREEAAKFGEWGYDFLKYDWCSYGGVAQGEGVDRLQRPYRKISAILGELERDLVLNLCQYGMGEVWEWGGEVGGHCWRTTGDLGLARGGLLPGFYSIGLSNARHFEHAGPGRWNDPDYLLIGWVGSAHRMGEGEPTSLTGNEQYSYMSMWSLMAAPLIFSGDMTKLDPFTLNVLCNHEVIEVNQDSLGQQARIVRQDQETLILAKELSDGSLAVGFFNLAEVERKVSLPREELGLGTELRMRDLWRQEELAVGEGAIEFALARHGVRMVRLWRTGS